MSEATVKWNRLFSTNSILISFNSGKNSNALVITSLNLMTSVLFVIRNIYVCRDKNKGKFPFAFMTSFHKKNRPKLFKNCPKSTKIEIRNP